MAEYDIAIVGAGIAGASLAAECAPDAKVVLLEAEDAPGYHTTGRSAAFWEECYGGPALVPLTMASGHYLRDNGFLKERGALYIAKRSGLPSLDRFMERFVPTGATIERVGRGALVERLPGLKPAWIEGIWQPRCSDIDVAALHQHYLAAATRAGAAPQLRARITDIARDAGAWRLTGSDGRCWTAKVLANAAGAWADGIAHLAGARALGIQPYRRTVAQLATDPGPAPGQPLVLDIEGSFYFKPEGDRIWLSPHDEEPSAACDAAPEELAIATAIDRYENVIDCTIRRVERKWAGLRSFSPDRLPVYGWDKARDGFFWFAGQGGFGIQTAPAAARLGAQLILGQARDALTQHLDEGVYSPQRFR